MQMHSMYLKLLYAKGQTHSDPNSHTTWTRTYLKMASIQKSMGCHYWNKFRVFSDISTANIYRQWLLHAHSV